MRTVPLSANGRSGVGQIILFDLVAVGLEQHRGAAQLAGLLFGPFDHPVTLVGLLIKHLPAGRPTAPLFGARLGLELGHLALLCGNSHGQMSGRPDFARFERADCALPVATAALSAGRRKGGVMADAGAKYNRYPGSGAESGSSVRPGGRRSQEPSFCSLGGAQAPVLAPSRDRGRMPGSSGTGVTPRTRNTRPLVVGSKQGDMDTTPVACAGIDDVGLSPA